MMASTRVNRMIVYFKLFLTAVCWGGTFIAGRLIAGHVGPFSAAFLRFLIATLFLFLLVWRTEGRLPPVRRGQILPVILLGLTGVFSYNVFFFKGLELIEAGRAAIIIANNPIFITLLSALIFRERLNFLKGAGVLLSVTGAMVVVSKGNMGAVLGQGLGRGEIFIFCSVASWVAFSLIGKAVMADLSPLVSVAYSAAVGALLLLGPALAEGLGRHLGHYLVRDWLSLFYLGIFGTVIGFVWYYQGIKAIGPMKASLFINFVPISAIVLAYFILREPITISLLIGTLLVCTGLCLTTLQVGKNSRSSGTPSRRGDQSKWALHPHTQGTKSSD